MGSSSSPASASQHAFGVSNLSGMRLACIVLPRRRAIGWRMAFVVVLPTRRLECFAMRIGRDSNVHTIDYRLLPTAGTSQRAARKRYGVRSRALFDDRVFSHCRPYSEASALLCPMFY